MNKELKKLIGIFIFGLILGTNISAFTIYQITNWQWWVFVSSTWVGIMIVLFCYNK